MTALVKSPLRRLATHVERLPVLDRDAAGFDSQPRCARHATWAGAAIAASRVAVSVRPHAYSARPLERRAPCGTHSPHHAFEEHTMARIGAFCITTWLAAAILYFGQHSVAMIVLSGVVVFGGFDLLRP
ncbi:hypothetical protein KDW20_28025 [Burkholderia cenocepacia]|uniref:hypothetical protein n=1 Tax=Burkholderia cepacia complex TaxID=87882 RepID=UPI00158A6A67|nr:hypothetical protein [Burkholderia cenocepacia]MBR8379628.1 hypothetical protein [Burkholderia cenocepacia]MBR8413735.1 hypothetical protein [Burkholderia cenocepacia]MDS0845943.1 hypothetical protein [Burkholderia cenocepacia]